MKYLFFITVIFSVLSLQAQHFKPLKAGIQSDWFADAELLSNDKIAIVHSHNTFRNRLYLVQDLEQNNNILNTISIYDKKMELVKERKIESKPDSIVIFSEIENDEVRKEILATGVLVSPAGNFLAVSWFDYSLNLLFSFIYKEETIHIEAKPAFYINSKGNIMVYGKEFNRNGKVLSSYKFRGQFDYETSDPDTYFSINPAKPLFLVNSVINPDTTIIIEGEAKNYDRFDIVRTSSKLSFTEDKNYVYVSALSNDCGFPFNRSTILKINPAEYCAELFYEDPTENCLDSRQGVLGIDLYDDDYIYFVNEAESCDRYPSPGFNPGCYTDYVYLRCLDKNGNLRWSKYLGGDANYSEVSVVATPDSGCLVLAVRYEHGLNLNITYPDSIPNWKIETDSYYLKFDKNGYVQDSLTTDVSVNELDSVRVEIYPNPVQDYLNINIPASINNLAYIKLFNLNGQLVLSKKISNQPIAVNHLSKGNYTYTLTKLNQAIHHGKIIKL